MELNDYQEAAATSNSLAKQAAKSDGDANNRALNAALFGLGSETGSLLDIQKKLLTDDLDLAVGKDRAAQELGDLLWYVSRVGVLT